MNLSMTIHTNVFSVESYGKDHLYVYTCNLETVFPEVVKTIVQSVLFVKGGFLMSLP